MILVRSGLLFASAFTFGAAAALWGVAVASIGRPDTTALADDRTAALALTGITGGLWVLHWWQTKGLARLADAMQTAGMTWLMDSMLTQHARKGLKKTGPLKVVR